MPLPPLYGHEDVRRSLVSARRRNRLPQSLLLHGPPGIGKERLGLWLAQLLLCGDASEEGPCGVCRSCTSVLRLEHPDVHWFFPLPRPKASSPEKLREALEDQRAEELALRRENPLHRPEYDRPPAYFVGAVRTIQAYAAMRPSTGNSAVFVVGDVDRMVPQEGSEEAANAFLKLLEEPPAGTSLILTSSRPGSLLPTIRSRILPVRLRPLADGEIADFLEEVASLSADEARSAARLAEGSVSRAIRLRPGGGDGDPISTVADEVRALLTAVLDPAATKRFELAHAQSSFGARGSEFGDTLDALAAGLRGLLRHAGGGTDSPGDEAAMSLAERASLQPAPAAVSRSLERVDRTRDLATGNVNPQLLLADLLAGIHRDLVG